MPLHYRLEDLPERFHRQVEAQLAHRPLPPAAPQTNRQKPPAPTPPTSRFRASPVPTSSPAQLVASDFSPTSIANPPRPKNLRDGKMSKPEIAFNRDFLGDNGLYEAITLRLPGGSRYTADFYCILDNLPTLVECKGHFRLGSEGRAHTAFLEAAAAFSHLFSFVWAVYDKNHAWSFKKIIPRSNPQPNIINNISYHVNQESVRESGRARENQIPTTQPSSPSSPKTSRTNPDPLPHNPKRTATP